MRFFNLTLDTLAQPYVIHKNNILKFKYIKECDIISLKFNTILIF